MSVEPLTPTNDKPTINLPIDDTKDHSTELGDLNPWTEPTNTGISGSMDLHTLFL